MHFRIAIDLRTLLISREVPKVNKGGESFFAGLIKKSFRDFKKSNHGGEVGGSQVFVNGHLIPDRVVKKAEKLAGPIQPGEYWSVYIISCIFLLRAIISIKTFY